MNPWPKNLGLRILAGFWSLPVALIAFLVAGILFAFRQVHNFGWKEGAWDLLAREGSWLASYRDTWGGFSLGWVVFYITLADAKNPTTRTHERAHLRQQLILGVFHWVFYATFTVVVWLACRSLHAYAANPFELDARRKAGESIGNLGPEPNGDRFPWW